MESISLLTEKPLQSSSRWRWFLFLILLLFFSLLAFTIVERLDQSHDIKKTTAIAAVPSVFVVFPELGEATIKLRLPGDVNPYVDTPIYARTDGYLKRWLVDIGAVVKAGDLLAEVESPEVDQQYNQAVGRLQQAQANFKLAEITAKRWKEMLDRNTVARQDSDQKQADLEVAKANVIAAEADVSRLQKLKDFEQITAPFDGVITQRNINIGDLIRASNIAGQKPLFELVDDKILRVYVNVPESLASHVQLGQEVTLEITSQPGKSISGKLVRTADKIDPQSRTLLVEIRVLNTDRKLLSGGYATVSLPIHTDHPALFLSTNTLLFRPKGSFVGVANEQGIVSLKKVRIGKDLGTKVEIVEGLDPKDRVILNPSDSLQNGDRVVIKEKS
ncbi:MAG: efflux RND transporter periplasmic adaptor subunit [Chthoniobacterales bacterium]|nr:efflux RND transporter periplasmic adaptor subunit [Chthoniobacterales bacterium]